MRVVIEVMNGCVYDIVATEPCDVIVVDRDEQKMSEEGSRHYTDIWSPRVDDFEVAKALRIAKTQGRARARLRARQISK